MLARLRRASGDRRPSTLLPQALLPLLWRRSTLETRTRTGSEQSTNRVNHWPKCMTANAIAKLERQAACRRIIA